MCALSRRRIFPAFPLLPALVVAAASARAGAQPLTLAELDSLGAWVDCREACDAAAAVDRQVCLDACGAPDPAWEKDGVAPVSRNDLDLAGLEIADAGAGTEICYRDQGRVVVPAALCPGTLCEGMPSCSDADCNATTRPRACPPVVCRIRPVRSVAACSDGDGDGVPAWLETATGTSDTAADAVCESNSECDFRTSCVADVDVGAARCRARTCGPDGCTAFHLETVAADDQQVLIHLWYDHSPAPARALDLLVRYDRQSLLLADARPLPNLSAFHKQLYTSHLSDGTLRVVIMDATSVEPIRPGPLVELVFQRISDDASTVSFSADDAAQEAAIAPLQGSLTTQESLHDDALWGPAALVPARADAERARLLLWYSFDAPGVALEYAHVPDGDALCARFPVCANETDPVERTRMILRLRSLQAGAVPAAAQIAGVVRGGLYLDGARDVLRLPVQVLEPYEAAGQSFTLSTWFYTEGNGLDENAASPQLLFTHNANDERTRFGLMLEPAGDGTWDLAFFSGDWLDPAHLSRTPVSTGIALRTWHHAAVALDASTGSAGLYFDGSRTGEHRMGTVPPPVSCPSFQRGSDVLLHEEGDIVGGQPSESLWWAPQRGPAYQIERADLNGQASARVVGDGQHWFQDVDYLPFLEKMVYSSNLAGQFEIWIADADGAHAKQLTVGFGDTARGIFARRPRWSPDGTAIVFESNVYDVLAGHNTGRGYQLYYVGYDPAAGRVAIALEGGGTAEQLDYAAHVTGQTIGGYQLTRAEANHVNTWWLSGRAAGGVRGEIIYEKSDSRFRGNVVQRLRIPDNIRETSPADVTGLGDPSDEKRVLSAFRTVIAGVRPQEVANLLYDRFRVSYEPSAQFTPSALESGDVAEVTVTHAPAGYAPDCWDFNHDRQRDTAEDLNRDGVYDENDCLPVDVRDLYVQFDTRYWDPLVSVADVESAASGTVLRPEAQGGVGKKLQLSVVETEFGSFVRVEILSPINSLPIPAGDVARVVFQRKLAGAPGVPFGLRVRQSRSSLFMKDLTRPVSPTGFDLAGVLDDVESAAFSPDGSRVLLSGTSMARPLLVKTRSVQGAAGAERLSQVPARVRGMKWSREQKFYPCNWVGGYRNPSSNLVSSGLRGGLDDLKIFAGVRDPDAIRSEAERGLERLRVEGRDGPVESRLPACGTMHADCPAFHLCVAGQCRMLECDPADPYACVAEGGRCVVRPVAVEQEGSGTAGFRWVCAAECAADTQCFTQACLNGPCRYCETATNSCIECRYAVQDYGTFSIAGIEGCPDRNSFQCVSGACRTECYTIRDGQSIYRCDPTLEYCRQGRCVTLDWDWTDFAPASLGALSETVHTAVPGAVRTVAIGEMSVVEFKAYGRGDYGHPPEVLVEGRLVAADGRSYYGGEWFEIGRVYVYNETKPQADGRRHYLHVPHPVSDLRMRLVHTPYEDLNAAASGLGGRDKDFCRADAQASARAGEQPDFAACIYRPPGSRFHIGYEGQIPIEEIAAACRQKQRAGCPSTTDQLRAYLSGESPSVIVSEVRLNGASATIDANPVCSYEGTLDPIEAGTIRPKKLYYGDIVKELSPEKNAWCAADPSRCNTATTLLDFKTRSGGAFALLNCNYDDPISNQHAGAEFTLPPWRQQWSSGALRETANSCLVEVDPIRREQCFEYQGGDTLLDPMAAEMELYQTLEFTLPRFFAHDEGFTRVPLPTFPLRVQVEGYAGGGLVLGNGYESLTIIGTGNVEAQFATNMPPGRRYRVVVERQPSGTGDPRFCTVVAPQSGEMQSGGALVRVRCGPARRVGGVLTGLAGDRAVLQLRAGQQVAGLKLRSNVLTDLIVSAGGPFEFPALLPEGASWNVSVLDQPRIPAQLCAVQGGSGTMTAQGMAGLQVSCEQTPPRVLGVTVQGLTGRGLVVYNRPNDEFLNVAADGTTSFVQRMRPGSTYEVMVSAQPRLPTQTCAVTDGTGTMPNRDKTDVRVVCTVSPTYAVKVNVGVVTGRGLELALNGGERLAVPAPGNVAFATRLLQGASYDVTVSRQPVDPVEVCTVTRGTGTVAAADVSEPVVMCSRPLPPANTFMVKGTVAGLLGHDFRIKLNSATQRLDIDRNGPFTFPNPLTDRNDYAVEVDTQPVNPTQTCTVANGTGRVHGADVTDVAITCVPRSTLALRFTQGFGGTVAVRGLAFAGDGAARGETRPDAQVGAGGGTVGFVEFGRAGESAPPTADLGPGNYTVHLWVNTDGSRDPQGRPTFQPGEPGLRRVVAVAAASQIVVDLTPADLAPTIYEPVLLLSQNIDPMASVECWWTHATGTRPALPPFQYVARASLTCDPGQGICFRYRSSTRAMTAPTVVNEPMTAGTYDLTCWWDANTNRSLDEGDLAGFAAGVRVDGPGVLTSQTSITLARP